LEIIQENIEGLIKKEEADLKNFQLVLIPIIENNHYYLVCFDLKNPAIEVIDNLQKSKSFVEIKDDPDYNKKTTVMKVVSITFTLSNQSC
jgi:hypothetical protein